MRESLVDRCQDSKNPVVAFGCLLAVSQGRNGPALSMQHTSRTTCMGYPSIFPNGKPVRPRSWGTQSPCFHTWHFAVPIEVQRGVSSGSPLRQPVPLRLNTSRTRPDLETAACLEGFTWHFLHMSMTGRHCFRPEVRETRHNKPETGAWCDAACLPTPLGGTACYFWGATTVE